jgi:hypothetical protein
VNTAFIIARTLLDVGALLPLVLIGFAWLVPYDQDSQYAYGLGLFGIGWLIAAIFIVYAWLAAAVPLEKRALWVVVLLLANFLALPFFWFWYVRPQNEWCSRYAKGG